MGLIFHAPLLAKQGQGYKIDTVQNSFSSISSLENITMPIGGPFGSYLQVNTAQIYFKPKFPQYCPNLTVAFWINHTYTTTTSIGVFTIPLKFYDSDDDVTTLTMTISSDKAPANTWSHIIMEFERDSANDLMKVAYYINGIHDSNKSFSLQGVSTLQFGGKDNNFIIGNGSSNFAISDVRLYDHLLSIYEINDLQKCLLCHYSFDITHDGESFKQSDFILTDETGNGLNPLVDTRGIGVDNYTKIGNGSAYFSGNLQAYIVTPRDLLLTKAFTCNMWVYMDDWSTFANGSTGAYRFISCTNGGGWNIEEYSGTGRINFAIYDSGIGYKHATANKLWSDLESGWHMFTMSFDGLNARLYIDTVLEATSPNFSSGAIGYYADNSLFIGAEAADSMTTPEAIYFKGYIDDFKMFAKVLSQADIENEFKIKVSLDNLNRLHAKVLVESSDKIFTSNKNYSHTIELDTEYDSVRVTYSYYINPNSGAI